MKVKQGESVINYFFKINLSTTKSMKRYQQFSIYMVTHAVIFKNNQITLYLCFTFITKIGVRCYCEWYVCSFVINGRENRHVLVQIWIPRRIRYSTLLMMPPTQFKCIDGALKNQLSWASAALRRWCGGRRRGAVDGTGVVTAPHLVWHPTSELLQPNWLLVFHLLSLNLRLKLR